MRMTMNEFDLLSCLERSVWGRIGAGAGMVCSVPPLGEVEPGQDAALARDPRVDLVVRQDHGVDLDGLEVVAVVAENAGHLHLPDLAELLKGEARRPASILIPKAIARPEVGELLAEDASERRPHHGAGQGLLGHAGRPQVDVVGGLVVLLVAVDGLVAHDAAELVEVVDPLEAAELAPGVVGRHAVLTTALDVEGGQVEAVLLAGLLEQVVGHLLGHRVVEGLGHLIDHAHEISVRPATFVEIVRLLQHLRQPLGADVAVALRPALDRRRQQGVAESEGARREAGGHAGVRVGVVPVEVALLLKDESVPLHDLLAQDHGQELVVGDVLDDGGVDVTRLLEQSLVVPVGVDDGELLGDQVVVPHEDRVDHGQDGLLVDARIASEETVDVLTRSDTTFVGFVKFQRQKLLEVELLEDRQDLDKGQNITKG